MRGTLLAAALAVPLVAPAAAERRLVTEGGGAAISAQSLIGHWRKVTEESCASRYPAEVRLRSGGVYDAPGAPEAGAYWHGGDWMIPDDGELVVQVANDAMVSYRVVAVSGVELTLEDAEGCRFTYRRDSA